MIDEHAQDTTTLPLSPPSGPGKQSRWKRLLSQTPDDFERRRERHQQRPMFVRIGVVALGGILSIPGVPLLVLLPDVGLPLLILGLGLLSLEFAWAARLLGMLIRWTASVRSWYRGLPGQYGLDKA
jgi:hypothetical protein